MTPMFVEIMLRAEAALERRLCGLAICQPKVIATLTIRPEIDLAAKEFFDTFDRRKVDIMTADTEAAIKIAVECCSSYRDFYRFWTAVDEINAHREAPNFGAELIAARTARKAIAWVESSGILEGVADG